MCRRRPTSIHNLKAFPLGSRALLAFGTGRRVQESGDVGAWWCDDDAPRFRLCGLQEVRPPRRAIPKVQEAGVQRNRGLLTQKMKPTQTKKDVVIGQY